MGIADGKKEKLNIIVICLIDENKEDVGLEDKCRDIVMEL